MCLQGLLREYAPFCLKSYYDKDTRKPFCQPQLWTEPYSNLMARLAAQQQQDGGALATTAAVVQALLASTGLAGQDEAGVAPPPTRGSSSSGGLQQSPAVAAAAAAARGAHLPGLQTNALLSLLKAAPQCVPFTVRLELFRQMIEQDKARGRWSLAPVEGGPRPVKLTVRRDALLEDAFRALAGLGHNIKARLMVGGSTGSCCAAVHGLSCAGITCSTPTFTPLPRAVGWLVVCEVAARHLQVVPGLCVVCTQSYHGCTYHERVA